jgi:hypothetical protein
MDKLLPDPGIWLAVEVTTILTPGHFYVSLPFGKTPTDNLKEKEGKCTNPMIPKVALNTIANPMIPKVALNTRTNPMIPKVALNTRTNPMIPKVALNTRTNPMIPKVV